ncbi:MAG: YihY/virulence factor BrkB family protein [Chloroflexota bacterium]|nr:YihY/virulence factor BrkB family protein [Chloroflexota bacterium]
MSTWNSIRKTIHEMNAPPIIRSIYDLFVGSLKKFATDDGTYLAAGMSYYIFFSIFPFLLGLLAFLGMFFNPEKAVDLVKDVLERHLPGIADSPLVYDNLKFVDFNRGLIGAIAVIGLLWTGSAVFGALSRMMNRIWSIQDKRSLFRRKFTDMLFTIAIGLVLSTNILIEAIYAIIGSSVGIESAGADQTNLIENLWTFTTIHILPPLLSVGVFAFIYNAIPQRKMKFRESLLAVILGAMVFEYNKSLFVAYIANFGNFDMVYGTISAVIILLLFAFISSIIVVYFAEVSNVFNTMRDKGRFRLSKEITFSKGGLKPYKI